MVISPYFFLGQGPEGATAASVKIDCGKAHFEALGTDVEFIVANNYAAFSGELTR
ncbi:MAG: hypothetical protein WCA32_01465 [Chromatiaceae bacterium]|jgi:hypothetical protein